MPIACADECNGFTNTLDPSEVYIDLTEIITNKANEPEDVSPRVLNEHTSGPALVQAELCSQYLEQ